MVSARKIAAIIVAVTIPLGAILYGYFPVRVAENISNYASDTTVIQSGNIQSLAFFSNLTVPEDAISAQIDMSLNITYYGTDTAANSSSIIVGMFSGSNNNGWSIEKAGYYQTSKGYYEILLKPISYAYSVPLYSHSNSSKLIGYDNVTYTYKGKSYDIGIDPTLNGPILEVHVNWITLVYTYQRI